MPWQAKLIELWAPFWVLPLEMLLVCVPSFLGFRTRWQKSHWLMYNTYLYYIIFYYIFLYHVISYYIILLLYHIILYYITLYYIYIYLGGGFEYFLCSPLFGEDGFPF